MDDLTIGIRTVLLILLMMIAALPGHDLPFRRELVRIWQSVNAPFLRKKEIRRKRGGFWEIDMTKFEP